MSDTTSGNNFIGLTAEIVSAYVSNNSVSAGDLPALINQVHSALSRVSSGHSEAPSEPLKPAISVKRSITPDHIVCLEDGKKFKSLKRHLRTQYNMTPEAYREKWDLPPDYPMVAPNYAAARSQLAKQMGLGQQRRRLKKPPKKSDGKLFSDSPPRVFWSSKAVAHATAFCVPASGRFGERRTRVGTDAVDHRAGTVRALR